ncbi:MFS transporter [Methylobacterium oryzisoli]|uniref:MFS transporter n=1 Tax=Methylobacterium oryzisoli TaxID=3385502 RepID=UPI0038916E9F
MKAISVTDVGVVADATAPPQSEAGAAAISARLDRLPASRPIWRVVVLISLGLFFELYDLFLTGYVTPGLVKAGILSAKAASLSDATSPWHFITLLFSGRASFIAALFSGLFIGTLCCGFLADRFGRKAVFTYSLLWYSAANAIMAFQSTAFDVNLWRFIAGLGIGVEIVTIGSYITELVPKHMRGRASALSQAIGFLSVPVVAFLSYLLVPTAPLGFDGWRWVVLVGAGGALVIWWIRRSLPESPRWLASKGRIAEADAILRQLESKVRQETGRTLPAPEPVAVAAAETERFSDIWKPPYRRRTVMMLIFHVFQTVAYYGFANWVPSLLIKHGITVTTSLGYTSIIALAAPVGPLIGLFVADRYERRTVILAMAGIIVVAGLAFSQQTDMLGILIAGLTITLAANTLSFTYHAYQAELYPTRIRARAVGFVYSWSRFSAIFTAFILEYLLNHAGVTGVFLFTSTCMVITMVAVGVLGPRTKDVSLETLSR